MSLTILYQWIKDMIINSQLRWNIISITLWSFFSLCSKFSKKAKAVCRRGARLNSVLYTAEQSLCGWQKSENIIDSKNSPEANSSPIKGLLKGIDWNGHLNHIWCDVEGESKTVGSTCLAYTDLFAFLKLSHDSTDPLL